MPNIADLSIGWKKETTYGTAVTVDRWGEYTDETLDWSPTTKQGSGLKVGLSGVPRVARRARTTKQGSGDVTMELFSKGLGTWFESLMGTGTSTLVSGTTYQQLFTFGADPVPLTIQRGLVMSDGTRDQYTFKGCVPTGFEIALPWDDIATVKASFDVRDMDTATAYATPSYPTGGSLFHWGQAAVTVGGTVTAPTATTLASGGTTVTNVRAMSVAVDHGMSTDRFLIGNSGLKKAPVAGNRAITGTIEVEHDSTTMRDAFIADTELPITLTFTSTESLSTGFAQLQVTLPACHLDSALPRSNGGQVINTSYAFSSLDNGTATQAIWIALRTSDTAL